MPLCARCQRVDFGGLFVESFEAWRRAAAEGYSNYQSHTYQHHDDIFEVGKAGKTCPLCETIFRAFKERGRPDAELARGVPVVFRAQSGSVEICYKIKETNICCLYWYMSEIDVIRIFEAFSITEGKVPPIYKLIEEDPSSKTCVETASGWLRDCAVNHRFCTPPRSAPPKRLIKVGNENADTVLIETAYAAQPMSWAALSYCWGGPPSVKLTVERMDELKTGIPFDDLDSTIQDAIIISRELGISYLWVDALCIVQDKTLGEWEEEATRMSDIYGGSVVTLVAASSPSARDGFLTQRSGGYVPVLFPAEPDERATGVNASRTAKVFLSLDSHQSEKEVTGPWANRGWTMQEGHLPNRLLHYTGKQMTWQCREGRKWECGANESLQDAIHAAQAYASPIDTDAAWFRWQESFTKLKLLPDYLWANQDLPEFDCREPFYLWYRLVEEFCPRALTKESDRLLGISRLAKLFGDIIKDQGYVAGLWKTDLLRGLAWYTTDAKVIPRRPYNRAFPSWSWASVGQSPIAIKENTDTMALSTITDVHVCLEEPGNLFGAIRSGSITITGPLKKLPRLYNPNFESAKASITPLEFYLSSQIAKQKLEHVDAKYTAPRGCHFAALKILRDQTCMELLILESLGRKLEGKEMYCRVGLLTVLPLGGSKSRASPTLVEFIRNHETSFEAKLGPLQEKAEMYSPSPALVAELKDERWKRETLILV